MLCVLAFAFNTGIACISVDRFENKKISVRFCTHIIIICQILILKINQVFPLFWLFLTDNMLPITKRNYANEAVLEALSEFLTEPTFSSNSNSTESSTTISYEAADEMSDDESSNLLKSNQRAKNLEQRIRTSILANDDQQHQFKRRKKGFQVYQDKPLPWWAQERKNQKSNHANGLDALDWQENLMYFYNLSIRPQLVLFCGLLVLLHVAYYYHKLLPDQVQICLREQPSKEWWCDVGTSAIKLIKLREFTTNGQNNANDDPTSPSFPINSKLNLCTRSIISTLSMNVLVVGAIQILPWLLSKDALPPPIEIGFTTIDSRRIALLSSFGYWLYRVGIILNILLFFINYTTYNNIMFTYESNLETPNGNLGRGTDTYELKYHYGLSVLSFLIVTILLLYQFCRIDRGEIEIVTEDMVHERLKESGKKYKIE